MRLQGPPILPSITIRDLILIFDCKKINKQVFPISENNDFEGCN